MLTFYRYPREHWVHLRTTNIVESPLAALRLRTDAAKRFKRVERATAVIWKMLMTTLGLELLVERVQQPAMEPRIKEAGMYELPPKGRVDCAVLSCSMLLARRRTEDKAGDKSVGEGGLRSGFEQLELHHYYRVLDFLARAQGGHRGQVVCADPGPVPPGSGPGVLGHDEHLL